MADGSNPEGSAINYTGNQTTAINQYISANTVPEPSGLILAALALSPLWRRRRRRRLPAGTD